MKSSYLQSKYSKCVKALARADVVVHAHASNAGEEGGGNEEGGESNDGGGVVYHTGDPQMIRPYNRLHTIRKHSFSIMVGHNTLHPNPLYPIFISSTPISGAGIQNFKPLGDSNNDKDNINRQDHHYP